MNGYEVKSKVNGNSIFLPAAGSRSRTWFVSAGTGGDYWSSTLDGTYTECADGLYFNGSDLYWNWSDHYIGKSVRPAISDSVSGKAVYHIYKTDGTYFSLPCSEVDSIVLLEAPKNEVIDGHEAVDLGLPSGTMWATCNVGAENPEEYGGYYAWGETEEKDEYTNDNSLAYGKSFPDIAGTNHDVAHVKWGGGWTMPTPPQFYELFNTSYCIWTWTTRHGSDGKDVNGHEVRSKANGNSIFLPAAGYRYGTSLNNAGAYGFYWNSTPDESDTDYAFIIYFNDSGVVGDWGGRPTGGLCALWQNQNKELLCNYNIMSFSAQARSLCGE